MTPERRANFQRLLKPRHIAFVGGLYTAIAIREARRRGFTGQMWAVNPKRAELEGLACVSRLADLPEAPDAVYLAIPAEAVPAALRELAAMGAGGVVCFSAGFKETGDLGAEQDLIDAAGDMALIGPNCYGLINYIDNTALWSFEHGGWSPGYGAAIITQSGMFSSDITMSARSLPLAYMVSAGNQAVLGLEDFLDVFAEDPSVRAIGLHIEGLQDIPAFERAALKAIEMGVAVVALKTGTSTIGSTLTVSHTGSLSGSAELYEALFARTGVISVSSPAQMLETLKYLCVVGAPNGPNLVGFTCSGGGATMLADHAEKIGLFFPDVRPQDCDSVAALLPEIATVSNPLDYTTPIWGQAEQTFPVFEKTMQVVKPDAAILVQDYPAAGLDSSKIYYQNDAWAFAEAARKLNVPAAICSTLPENLDRETRRHLISQGVAPMQGIHEALNAIQDAATWAHRRIEIARCPPAPLLPAAPCDEVDMLTEDQGKDWLQANGFAVPNGETTTRRNAGDAATKVGYPVALKMMSPHLAHKSEAGAVALGIRDAAELQQALEAMDASVAAYDKIACTDRYLVEAMSPAPVAELIVTLKSDPQFAPALVLGSGGVLAELVSDVVTLLLPATSADILKALSSLRVSRLLTGYRGGAVADLPMIASGISSLCETFLKDRESISEIELNPVFAYPDRIVAVDALIHRFAR